MKGVYDDIGDYILTYMSNSIRNDGICTIYTLHVDNIRFTVELLQILLIEGLHLIKLRQGEIEKCGFNGKLKVET